MSLGIILVIILVIFLLGGFSGRFGGYGYGYGHRGVGLVGIVLIILLILALAPAGFDRSHKPLMTSLARQTAVTGGDPRMLSAMSDGEERSRLPAGNATVHGPIATIVFRKAQ